MNSSETASDRRVAPALRAWAVHLYTAVGAVLALLMVHLAYAGETLAVLWLFGVAMVIDGTDGFLARATDVKGVLPGFDGELLDNIVDYMTYALAPMALLLSTGHLPAGGTGLAVAGAVLLAACYQFCRSDAKTDDHFFLGFPSYWNIVAFYVVVLDLPVAATVTLLVALVVASFVPVRYLYPSRTQAWWPVTMTLTALWFGCYALILLQWPDPSTWVLAASAIYLAYYLAMSLWLTVRGQESRRSRA